MNQGFRKTLQTAKDYPSIFLLPAFSVWTFGSIEKGSCKDCKSSQKIGLSFYNSSLNALYTLCFAITVTIITVSSIGYEIFISYWENLSFSLHEIDTLALTLMLPVIVVSIIFMSVVACMDTCSCCSCLCCCDCLLPMTERTSNTFGLQEEAPTEIALVETNPPASQNNDTTSQQTKSVVATIEIQEEATETTQV